MTASFSLLLPSPAPAVDVFSLWTPSAELSSEEIWSADLPDDPAEAHHLLEDRAASLHAMERALENARFRMDADFSAVENTSGISFSLNGEEGSVGGARAVLAAAISAQNPGVSFGPLDGLQISSSALEEAARIAASFSEQVRRSVENLALIETRVNGRRTGLSRAGWSGSLQTWWALGGSSALREQHQRVIAQSLATRRAWMRVVCLTAGGIARVTATIAAGPFSLITIWTTWTYLQEIIKEARSALAAPAIQ